MEAIDYEARLMGSDWKYCPNSRTCEVKVSNTYRGGFLENSSEWGSIF
jgi:hypothetical protein